MVAKKFRKGEVDWLALTHATSCSIVGPKGKTIEDKSLRRISDISNAETRCPAGEVYSTDVFC